jgi:ketol-acid reductoisomerase
MQEVKSGNKKFNQLRDDAKKHQIEEVGERLRTMMPWIGKDKLVNRTAN